MDVRQNTSYYDFGRRQYHQYWPKIRKMLRENIQTGEIFLNAETGSLIPDTLDFGIFLKKTLHRWVHPRDGQLFFWISLLIFRRVERMIWYMQGTITSVRNVATVRPKMTVHDMGPQNLALSPPK